MNWFPVFITMAVAGVPFVGFKNPGLALSLLVGLGAAVFIWMAIDVWKTLRAAPAVTPQPGSQLR